MKTISVKDVSEIIRSHGYENIARDLMSQIKSDFKNWDNLTKIPRPAMHVEDGVLELMPVCDDDYYGYKYVNCHPNNPRTGKMTVVATGQLSEVSTGYPLMFSEMTLLTALRTAATSAVATELMSRKDSQVMAVIGTGAQSEFQVRTACLVRDIKQVRYFDIDEKAMDKFEQNMSKYSVQLIRCSSAEDAVSSADIVTVCTACKKHVDVIKSAWIKSGTHINALGGDTVGKTELELDLLYRSRIVVEYFEQSIIEGEIQRLNRDEAGAMIVGELHELMLGQRQARLSSSDITLFDSVGVAVEDLAALKLFYCLAKKYNVGKDLDFVPEITDPKDLISLVSN